MMKWFRRKLRELELRKRHRDLDREEYFRKAIAEFDREHQRVCEGFGVVPPPPTGVRNASRF